MRLPEGRLLGAHESIVGGPAEAVETADRIGCTALQIFLRPNQNWRAPPLPESEVERFRSRLERSGVRAVVAHSTYLANLASPEDALWSRSIDVVRDELERGARLGVSHLILHPGAHVGSGEEAALARVAAAVDRLHAAFEGPEPRLTLEVTAGQGTCVGHRFWHLAAILERVAEPERVAVCLDTCHLLAAGYDVRDEAGWRETLASFDRHVGLDRVEVFHLNDAKKGLYSRVDRHEHIGEGRVGSAGFRALLALRRFRATPMILETPKDGDALRADARNLRRLVSLMRPAAGGAQSM